MIIIPQSLLRPRQRRCEPRRRITLSHLHRGWQVERNVRWARCLGCQTLASHLTRLAPGAVSALRHAHSQQDEFIYILAGQPLVVTDAGATSLSPGRCAGFKAGTGNGHHLVNRTAEAVVYLEVGDRSAGDSASYPADDIQAVLGKDGQWQFVHKDGTPYSQSPLRSPVNARPVR